MEVNVGVWIDKRCAKIVSGHNGGQIIKTVESNLEEFHPKGGSGSRMKGGPQDVVQDSKYLEREKHQLKDYFSDVMKALPELEELVVFGPSQTGLKLADEIKKSNRNLGKKLRSVERADSMTDNQVVAWVREYFN